MKPKFQINDRVITPSGPGVIVGIEPSEELRIILDSGKKEYWFPEDVRKEGNHGKATVG